MISAQFKEQPLHVGDTLRVHAQVIEGSKTRIQIFEGILISLRGRGENKTFTVRRIGAGGVGVERSWPLDGKSLVKIEVKKKAGKVRRSKLYYLRERSGKQAIRI
ncbi:50S ribosomal protein L19 [Candidatus Daviesbacteria bacterium]|nr:50S ribosomal protein L19 [Candidatus Daviesbacteria bacterium]